MKPHAVVIILYADESADIKNHESMGDALKALGDQKQRCAALIHTGDIWSEIGAFFKILHNHSGSTLVTEDAMQQPNTITNFEKVTTYYESQTHRPVGVFSFQFPKHAINLQDHETVDDVMDDSLDFKATPAKEISPSSVEEQIEAIDKTDPFMLLQQAPDWLLDLKISQLVQLTGRLESNFQSNGVNTVSDIMLYDAESMLRWPGFGKKSLTSLSESLCLTEQVYTRSNDDNYRFCDALDDAMDSLNEQEGTVFEKRFGFNCEALTLEQVGEIEGVTRERIRQIEVKAVNKIRPYPLWSLNLLSKHLEDLLQNREEPLLLNNLAGEDAWFSGFAGSLECMADLIELITEQSFSVFEIRSRAVICRLHETEWVKLISEVLAWVKEQETTGLTKADILSFGQSCLRQQGAAELAHELHAAISDKLHFSTAQSENDEAVLVSVGRGYVPLVLSVLREISAPMHFREITELCIQKDPSIDERRVQNILVEHAYLYALGTYGLKEHLPSDVKAVEKLKAELEEIIFSGDPARQWNCQNLAEQLHSDHDDMSPAIDKYIVNIVLGEVPRLKSLGRLVWIRTDKDASNSRRIDIQEMATQILKQFGRPMSIDEIKHEVSTKRGVGEYFLLKTTDQIARVSKAMWGVVGRDFYMSRSEIHSLLNALNNILKNRWRAIHMEEINAILSAEGHHIPASVTEYMVMSLAGMDARFRLGKDRMLGLSIWPDVLMKQQQVVETAVSEADGMINLHGSKVVLTGTFKSMRRKEAKARLEALGVSIADKITSDTDYLIAGEDVQFNSKYKTAKQTGISILNEKIMLHYFREKYEKASGLVS